MFFGRSVVVCAVATAVVTGLLVLTPGCGSESVDVDAAARYTPETLAQELVMRYRGLKPEAQISKVRVRSKKSGGDGAGKQTASKKSSGKVTKKAGAPTIDEILDDIESKVPLVKATKPDETIKKMVETISKDSSLTDADKKALTEHLGRLDV